MTMLNLKKAIEHKPAAPLQQQTPETNTPPNKEPEIAPESIPEETPIDLPDENAIKLERLGSEDLLHLDMSSVREAVGSGDMRKIRKAGQRAKKNEANDRAIHSVSNEAFLNFKTFVPVSGNIFGKDMAHGKAVHLTLENEKFIKRLMLDQDVRKNAVVNHIIDIVRIYFKK